MTHKQIENFRKVLVLQLGPYALLMSDDDVVRFRDRMQAKLDIGKPDPDPNNGHETMGMGDPSGY